ncbi:hypothetical protein OV203_21780 [Nannocystis sp. ILAH1]|nr:hypothetical protein [Nannocystis sp. ILAH1]MCY0989783.1 hypothetical protein [Nannocystis sp. ILAH1]
MAAHGSIVGLGERPKILVIAVPKQEPPNPPSMMIVWLSPVDHDDPELL